MLLALQDPGVTSTAQTVKAAFRFTNATEYFAGDGNPNPARTTIEINALPTPIAVEVKVVATID